MSEFDYLFARWNRLPSDQQREVFPRLLGRLESSLEARGSITAAAFAAAFETALRRGEAHAAAALPPACEAAVEHWISSPAGQACIARAILKFAGRA